MCAYLLGLAGHDLDGCHENLVVVSVRGKGALAQAVQQYSYVAIALSSCQILRGLTENVRRRQLVRLQRGGGGGREREREREGGGEGGRGEGREKAKEKEIT